MSTVLGVHTLAPGLQKVPQALLSETILAHSSGFLPPYLLVVGDRRRVEKAAQLLDQATILPHWLQKNELDQGRVHIAVGLFKGTPIAIVEHEMGCSAAEIIVKEIVFGCMSRSFKTEKANFNSDAKYVLRVGSSAGINKSTATDISAFDLVVVSHQLGMSGADMQSLTGQLNYFDPQMASSAKTKMLVCICIYYYCIVETRLQLY